MLQIGVDARDGVARGRVESVDDRGAQAGILHAAQDSHARIGRRKFLGHGPGQVRGVVIHDENFVIDAAQCAPDLLHQERYVLGFVQCRGDYAQSHDFRNSQENVKFMGPGAIRLELKGDSSYYVFSRPRQSSFKCHG